jgi:hypothetical protein
MTEFIFTHPYLSAVMVLILAFLILMFLESAIINICNAFVKTRLVSKEDADDAG